MATSSSARDRALATATVLAVVAVAGMWVLTRTPSLTLGGDNAMLRHPLLADAFRQVAAGKLPLFTGGRWGGSALLADAEVGALYLPYYVGYALTAPPHVRAMDVVVVLHLAWLAAGLAWLFATLGIRPIVAVVATLVALANPTLVHIARNWSEYWAAISWWPWLLGATLRLEATAAPRAAFLAIVALAAQAYAGYPQLALYSGVVALGLLVASAPSGRTLALAAIVGLGAVGLAGPALVTGLLGARDSVRFAPVPSPDLVALADAFALGPAAWVDVVRATPTSPLLPCKLAPVTLVLALVGAVTGGTTARRLGIAALVAAVLASRPTVLFRVVHALPPASYFAGPVKLFYLAAFLVLVLAGIGLDRLVARVRGRALAAALVLLVLADAARFAHGTAAVTSPRAFSGGAFAPLLDRPPATFGAPRATRWLALADGPPLRQVGLDYGALWGVDAWNGVGPLASWRQLEVMERADPAAAAALVAQVGADGVVVLQGSRVETDLVAAGFTGAPVATGLRALVPPGAPVPRYVLVARARAVTASDAIAAARAGRALTRDEVLVEAEPAGTTWSGDPAGALAVATSTPGFATLVATVRQPTWLVARIPFSRAWVATLDGWPATVHPAGGFLMGVLVPRGRHTLVLHYRAEGLRTGAVLALLATALVPALVGVVGVRPGAAKL